MDKFKITPEIQARIDSDFQCRRCNECCRRPGYVYLKDGEAEKIAEYLKMQLYDFTDQHCEVIDRRRSVLKKLPDETCIFLELPQDSNSDKLFEKQNGVSPEVAEKNESVEKMKSLGCMIHPVKPEQCKEFPYRWHTPSSWDYCAGLRELRAKIES